MSGFYLDIPTAFFLYGIAVLLILVFKGYFRK